MGTVESNDEQVAEVAKDPELDAKHQEIEQTSATRQDMRDLIGEIICPFTFKITRDLEQKKVSAVNYDTTFVGSVNLGDERGSWKIAPQLQLTDEGKEVRDKEGYKALKEEHVAKNGQNAKQMRPYSLKFYQELEGLVEDGKISWFKMNEENDKGRFLRLVTTEQGSKWEPTNALVFYFTHEQGKHAAARYIEMVLAGQLRANKRSWENRYETMTDVSYEDLEQKYPDTYATRTRTGGSKETIVAENVQAKAADIFDDDEMPAAMEPTNTEMFGDPEDEDEDGEEDLEPDDDQIETAAIEEGVAASAGADLLERPDVKDAVMEEIRGGEMITLRLTGYDRPERMTEDTFIHPVDHQDVQYYKIELPELELPLFAPVMSVRVEDNLYNFVTEDDGDEDNNES